MSDLAKIGAALVVGGAIGALAASQNTQQLLHATPKAAAPAAAALPKLYVYDHCPFCVRARVILGLKSVKHDLIFLASADEATPIGLVGAKQAPIFHPVGGKPFPESLDIVRYVDEHYGSGVLLKESADREDLKNWIKEAWPILSVLYYPRIHAAPLPEFAQHESREYFRKKKEQQVAVFSELIAKTPETVAKVNELLKDLAGILHSSTSVNEHVSYDDIDLFGRLRALTLVKDIQWPPKVRAYIDHFSKAGDIPLFDAMATF
jgi:glutaredoxin 2